MRHADVGTTMKYYVTINADAVADAVWAELGICNSCGNNRPREGPESGNRPPPTESDGKPFTVKPYASGGHGNGTRNPFRGTTFQCAASPFAYPP